MKPTSAVPWTHRPAVGAALISCVYVLAASAYIAFSSSLAASLAGSVQELERIERLKGIGFVATTGLLLFLAIWAFERRLARERVRLATLERDLLESETLRMPALLANSMAHDLNDLLQTATLQAEALRAAAVPPSMAGIADELERSLQQLTAVNAHLRDFGAVDPAPLQERFEVGLLLEDVAKLAVNHEALRARGLVCRLSTHAHLHGDRTLLGRALFNLLLSAGLAARRDSVQLTAREVGGQLEIEVHDDGLPPEPGARTPVDGLLASLSANGAPGLRWVTTRAAAGAFRGALGISTSQLGGTCARLTLPLELEVLNGLRRST